MATRMGGSLLHQYGDMPDEPMILTGPVIGLVTDSSCRILIETNVQTSVRITLKSPKGHKIPKELQTAKRQPVCFEFTGLNPETFYTVSCSVPTPGLVGSSFTTLPLNWNISRAPARLACVTGNNYAFHRDNVDDKADLWWDIYRKIKANKLDYVIHTGDNVFIDTDDYQRGTESRTFTGDVKDSRWLVALSLLEGLQPSQWSSQYQAICELFRGAYRELWNTPSVKHVLANVPNLMILNDHEICDNFGAHPADHDPYSPEYFVSCCAYEVYNQYQRSLFEDYEEGGDPYDSAVQVRQAYHFHAFGELGLLFLDTRACSTFHMGQGSKNPEKEYELPTLGQRQWNDIEYALSDSGYLSNCRILFVVTPTPVCLVGENKGKLKKAMNKKLKNYIESNAWINSASTPEASYFLSMLFDWRAKNPGVREVCLVSGGCNPGATTEVVDCRYLPVKDIRVSRMKQVIVPPISAKIDKMHLGVYATGKGLNNIGAHHQFKHFSAAGHLQGYAVFDAFVDTVEKQPELGKMTRHVSRIITSKADKAPVALKAINSTQKVSVPFAGGCCGCGAKSNALKAPPSAVADPGSRNYSLVDYTSTGTVKQGKRGRKYSGDDDASTAEGSIYGASVGSYDSLV